MYESFAQVYDTFMDNVPYEEWGTVIAEAFHKEGIEKGLVLDLGCGTGNMTKVLAQKGYDLIGVDASEEMLDVARWKQLEGRSSSDILYLLQDMRNFELYGTVGGIVSCCDSINYILEEEELLQVFRLVNNYLDPKGIFFFDFNTEYKYKTCLGNQTIAEEREESSFIWENEYEEKEERNFCYLTLFIQVEDALFQRFQETHIQRGYSLETIKGLLEKSGLEFLEARDGYTKNPATLESERITVIAREHGK